MTKAFLGEGVFTWSSIERRSDRYGSVYLIPEGRNSLSTEPCRSLILPAAKNMEGARGELVAVVTKARESTHIGDLFHGVFPSTPEVGQIIILGKGTFFVENISDPGLAVGLAVGLRPDDGRASLWLNIHALYKAHEQSVKLYLGETR